VATEVLLPVLAIVGIWTLVAVVVAGSGYVVRRALFAVLGSPVGGISRTDVWLGLATLVAYLLVWNMFLAVTWWTWAVPLVAGAWGTFAGLRSVSRPRLDRRAAGALVAVAAGWAILADQALGPADDYDFGLYHLNLITYAEHYAAVPGLANLHIRLGAGDAHLLLAAFLDRSPVAGAGPHLVVGLLVSLLLLDVGLRLARPGNAEPSFSRRLAVLLVPAVVVIASLAPQQRLSSPNLDLGVVVAAVVGMLYLAECIERGFDPGAGLTGAAMLAVASATRPLYWPLTVFAAAVFVFGARTARAALAVFALPALVAAGWVARQAVLSGYPLYPLSVGRLSTNWRVPTTVITSANRGDEAWARWPGIPPDTVLASWHWLHAYWLPQRERDADVVAPLLLLASLGPSLVAAATRDPGRRRRSRPMLAVVVPSLAILVVWFLTAPDPRFVFGLIWLVPTALAAWALPPLGRPSARSWTGLAAVTAAGAAGIAWLGRNDISWMLPAGLIAAAVVTLIVLGLRGRYGPLVAWATILSTSVGACVFAVGSVHLERGNGNGPLGIPLPAAPQLVTIATSSGLDLSQPANASDQCWQVMLCVPTLISTSLHLRGSGIAQGFSVSG
jgi:hypothetical protein